MTDLQQISAFLKEVYPDSKIDNLVNTATAITRLVETRSDKKLGGRDQFIPIEVGLPGGVGSINADGGGIVAPAPGTWRRFQVAGGTINGTIDFTYAVQQYAPGPGNMAFASAVKLNMDGLAQNIALAIDRRYYTGNKTKALTNTRSTSTATSNAFTVAAPAAGTLEVQYNGEWELFKTLAPSANDSSTWIHVDVIRLDNQLQLSSAFPPGAPYGFQTASTSNGLIDLGPDATRAAVFISAVNTTAKSVTLSIVADDAGATLDLTGGAHPTLPGFAFAIRINPTQVLDTAAAPFGRLTAEFQSIVQEANGILESLFTPTYFGVDRFSPDSVVVDDSYSTRLQSWAPTVGQTGVQARTTLTVDALQRCLDFTLTAQGNNPDYWIVYPTQMSKYQALLTPVSQSYYIINQSTPGKADPIQKYDLSKQTGDTGKAFGNIPILASQNCPLGLWIGLSKSTWSITTTEAGGEYLPNEGGGVVFNVRNTVTGLPTTAFIVTWLKIYQLICHNPAANVVLSGMTI